MFSDVFRKGKMGSEGFLNLKDEQTCYGCGGNQWQPVATGGNLDHIGATWGTERMHGLRGSCMGHGEDA